jgi:predicted RNA binding protein YcfA (HicA-like mRNA interferase family)
MKSSELLRKLKADGWFEVRQSGSHKIMRHSIKKGEIVFPDHGSKEVPTGTMKAIYKMAGLK